MPRPKTNAPERGVYAIVDRVAGDIFGGLQLHFHDASAIRAFRDLMALPNSPIGRNPKDYELHYVGLAGWDDDGDPMFTGGHELVITGTTLAGEPTE